MDDDGVVLDLYVAGDGHHTATAVANLETIRDRLTSDGTPVTVTVHDLGESPELARTHSIVLTPTLIRRRPEPERRVVGDLSLVDLVIRALRLGSTAPQPRKVASP